MTQTERELLDCLQRLDSAARSMAATSPKPDLGPLFERIVGLTGQLPPETDPELLHYLRKKSFEKARLHLEGLTGR